MVLWIMALSLGAGLILALRPKTYPASGMLQIRPGAANVYKSQGTRRRLIRTAMIGSSLRC